jgi:hypothetical protein
VGSSRLDVNNDGRDAFFFVVDIDSLRGFPIRTIIPGKEGFEGEVLILRIQETHPPFPFLFFCEEALSKASTQCIYLIRLSARSASFSAMVHVLNSS